MTPLSIVIPTFNRVAILRNVLEALANQQSSHHSFEGIVIDDGSS